MMKVIIPRDIELLSCSIPESDSDDGAEWDESATYAKDAKVRRKHVSYASLEDKNKGNDPEKTYSGDNAKWKRLEATRPYRMFDDFVNTQTRSDKGDTLSFCVKFDRCDAFAMLNLEGYYLRVNEYDLDYSEDDPIWPGPFDWLLDLDSISLWEYIYNPVLPGWTLVRDISRYSLYEYNYTPIEYVDKFARSGLPMCISGKLCVEIDPGDKDIEAAVGHFVIGRQYELGWTEYDAELGFIDYSRKTTDEFGATTFVRRHSTNSMSLPIYLHPDQADYVANVLNKARGKPCLWIGDNTDDGFESLTIWGWLEDYRMVYQGPSEMRLSLEIQGLI